MRKFLSSIPVVRPLFIRCLKATAFDTSTTNPWTKDKLFLNSYKHKGYWYFKRAREAKTMVLFQKKISKGDTVLEVGGHIGFITQYFSQLVGNTGKVIVFEPGSNNLRYIEKNISDKNNVSLEKIAVADTCGTALFYEDNITGQNNSLLSDYKNADAVAKSHRQPLNKTSRKVQLTTLDSYLSKKNIDVDFIKIDIEGYELQALQGMTQTLKNVNNMMIEVTENHQAVSKILSDNNYEMCDENGKVLSEIPKAFSGNIFATKRQNH